MPLRSKREDVRAMFKSLRAGTSNRYAPESGIMGARPSVFGAAVWRAGATVTAHPVRSRAAGKARVIPFTPDPFAWRSLVTS